LTTRSSSSRVQGPLTNDGFSTFDVSAGGGARQDGGSQDVRTCGRAAGSLAASLESTYTLEGTQTALKSTRSIWRVWALESTQRTLDSTTVPKSVYGGSQGERTGGHSALSLPLASTLPGLSCAVCERTVAYACERARVRRHARGTVGQLQQSRKWARSASDGSTGRPNGWQNAQRFASNSGHCSARRRNVADHPASPAKRPQKASWSQRRPHARLARTAASNKGRFHCSHSGGRMGRSKRSAPRQQTIAAAPSLNVSVYAAYPQH
jgi:hypothetical protein